VIKCRRSLQFCVPSTFKQQGNQTLRDSAVKLYKLAIVPLTPILTALLIWFLCKTFNILIEVDH
jgi:hypothetical protein